MFEIIPIGTKIDFMKYRIPMIVFSGLLTATAFFFILSKGFNYGVDFAGGIELVLSLPKTPESTAENLRAATSRMGIADASVQSFGSTTESREAEFILHFPADFAQEPALLAALNKSLLPKLAGGSIVSFRLSGLEKAYLTLSKSIPLADLSQALAGFKLGLMELQEVQNFGRETQNEYQITFKSIQNIMQAGLLRELKPANPDQLKIEKIDFVGAKVGRDLKLGAIISIILTAIFIFLYIFIRFDLVYAPGVVLSMIHDVSIVAGFFAFFKVEFDLTTVAALLTLAGYSINDTIIVYDRIREVSGNLRGKTFSDIINIAVNQTLSRTIVTSGTVFIATFALWAFGGPVIHGFAWAFLIGVVVGTYSSVFVAAPTILWMDRWIRGSSQRGKKAAA